MTESGQVKFEAGRDQNGHSDAASGIVLAIKAVDDHPGSIAMPINYYKPSVFF